MGKRSITSPLSIIELPQQINGLSGKFQYYSYEPDERASIENMGTKVNYYESAKNDLVVKIPPRFIDISIKQTDSPFYTDNVVIFRGSDRLMRAGMENQNGGLYDEYIIDYGATYKSMVAQIQSFVLDEVEEFSHSSTPGEGSLYFTQDFCQGFVRKTSGDGANSTQLSKLLSSTLGEKKVLEYVKTTLSGSLYVEGDIDNYEEQLMNGVNSMDAGSQLVILDPNTLLPTKEAVFDQSEDISSDAYINGSYVHQIFNRTNASPAAETIPKRTMEIAGLVEAQAEIDKEKRYLSSLKYQVFSNTNSGEGVMIPHAYFLGSAADANNGLGSMADQTMWVHIGYQVQKYIIEGENRLYRGAFFVTKDLSDSFTSFRDPYVLYGKDYYYEVRDAWVCMKTIGVLGSQIKTNVGEIVQDATGLRYDDLMDLLAHSRKEVSEGVFEIDPTTLEAKLSSDVTDKILQSVGKELDIKNYTIDDFIEMFEPTFMPTHSLGFIILGTQTTSIDVTAREKFPPLPPTGFSFKYQGNNEIKISWNKNVKIWENVPDYAGSEANVTADDVGGFLLFVRNDLLKPYELYRQFHLTTKERPPKIEEDPVTGKKITTYRDPFSVNVQSNIVGLVIGENNIEYAKDSTDFDHVLTLRSNVDYYVAMASYDLHGNISPYSEQFFIRKNNVTGEILTTNICGSGAPLSYPNITIPSKFVLSSMKASGYRYLEVFQTPTTEHSYPTEGKMTIQLIDLETEADVTIEGFRPSQTT